MNHKSIGGRHALFTHGPGNHRGKPTRFENENWALNTEMLKGKLSGGSESHLLEPPAHEKWTKQSKTEIQSRQN